MEPMAIWLFIFVALYWGYCIFWGIKGALWSRTASDYFVAGRSVSMWVFMLAATATSFSGWTFVGHPGLIFVDGFQYAYASFYSITIPFTGMMFLKRQWMIGKRWGYITPGEMFADYFRTDSIRILILIVALIFAVPYLGIQLRASGFLFNVLTDGALGVTVGMWLLSLVVLFYVALGGLRAVAYVDAAQAVMLMVGILVIGVVAMYYVGSWTDFTRGIAALAQWDLATGGKSEVSSGLTPAGHSGYVAIPGVIQWVGSGAQAQGGAWTGIMNLSYMFALMGIMAAPSFSMWAFSNSNPRPFAPQQTWMSPLGVGFLMMVFLAIQGMSGHILGGNTEFAKDVYDPQYEEQLGQYRDLFDDRGDAVFQRGLIATHNPELSPEEVEQRIEAGLQALENGEDPREAGWVDLIKDAGADSELVPQLVSMLSNVAPWLAGLLAVAALAAMQSTGAAYMSTTSGMFTRDLLRRYIMPNASNRAQVTAGRIFVAVLIFAALMVATFTTDALVLLGGLATAMGTQMWVPLAAICFLPWLTRQGVVTGLIVGVIAVLLTENIGISILGAFGVDVPWGRWPLTLHSAAWGVLLNFLVAVIISAFTQNEEDRKHRMTFHSFLREHASLPAEKRHLIPLGWIVVIVWFFFAMGPGAVIGNWLFGDPNNPETWWVFGMPSIWVWQLIWWVLGIAMMWFMCYKLEMSTVPPKEIKVLYDEDAGSSRA